MSEDHVHKYIRVILGGKKIVRIDGKRFIKPKEGYVVYKCILPGCNHYVPRELAVGRKSICWFCGGELVLNMENTTKKKPTHVYCRRSKASNVA